MVWGPVQGLPWVGQVSKAAGLAMHTWLSVLPLSISEKQAILALGQWLPFLGLAPSLSGEGLLYLSGTRGKDGFLRTKRKSGADLTWVLWSIGPQSLGSKNQGGS